MIYSFKLDVTNITVCLAEPFLMCLWFTYSVFIQLVSSVSRYDEVDPRRIQTAMDPVLKLAVGPRAARRQPGQLVHGTEERSVGVVSWDLSASGYCTDGALVLSGGAQGMASGEVMGGIRQETALSTCGKISREIFVNRVVGSFDLLVLEARVEHVDRGR